MKSLPFILFSFLLVSCNGNKKVKDHLNLEPQLSGTWSTKAFDGALHETWKLNDKGWMEQEGYYIVKGDTAYAAMTQIQEVGNDIILFSVIENSNPKIFKSVKRTENIIVFENDDYKNPYQVQYEFISKEKYIRTITGYENDSIVIFEFNFEKYN